MPRQRQLRAAWGDEGQEVAPPGGAATSWVVPVEQVPVIGIAPLPEPAHSRRPSSRPWRFRVDHVRAERTDPSDMPVELQAPVLLGIAT